MNRSGLVVVGVVLATLLGCRGDDARNRGRSEPPATAAATLSSLRARPGSPLAAGAGARLESVGGAIIPQFASQSPHVSARVTLPARASAPLRVEDAATGIGVDVSLNDARDVAADIAEGYAVYPRGHTSGATLLHRALPEGIEDFVSFDTRPESAEIAYSVLLGKGVAGLRLVAGMLEMLDADGAPRLRVAPPYIVGADGARTDAALAVAGCAVDTNAAAPWGRRVTPPGADRCKLFVRWNGDAVAYPAVLDPRWTTTTNTMTAARQDHAATLITAAGSAAGKVLVTGGRANGTTTTALGTAELFDPATNTWAGTTAMGSGNARWSHSGTQLNTSGNATTSGKVLIAGGINGTTSIATARLYNPADGTWAAAGSLSAGRHLHTATLIPSSGNVVVIGGLNNTTVLDTAAVYNPATMAGSWTNVTPVMASRRRFHTATLLTSSNANFDNRILVAGGNSGGTTSVGGVQLFNVAGSTWSNTTALPAAREGHTATRLANGNVLVTGGKTGTGSALASALVFTIPASGTAATWPTTGSMAVGRVAHTATLLPAGVVVNGQVLVAGGSTTGTSPIATAQYWNGSTWSNAPTMTTAVMRHTATILSSGMVLIAGGSNGSAAVNTARVFETFFCTTGTDCASGFCVGGVCCNNACTGECQACNLTGSLGTCTPKPNGTACTADTNPCTLDQCNGSSTTCQHPAGNAGISCRAPLGECDLEETCTGSSTTCPTDTKKNPGTPCTDDGIVCTADQCNGTAVTCQHPAGNPGTTCRAPLGECDLAETCTGSSTTCPTDAKKNPGTPCTDDGIVCTADQCNGTAVTCQHPAGNPGTTCRAPLGECDLAETCTGSSTTCPTDAKKNPGTPCTDDGIVCTADQCDGTAVTCQHPAGNAGTTCRAPLGECDLAETCTGSSATCPTDGKKTPGTPCTDDGIVCTADQCDGTAVTCQHPAGNAGTTCRAPLGECDLAETCTGSSATCPTDVKKPSGTTCRAAADLCDQAEACSGSSDACPADAKQPNGTVCNDGNACTTDDVCNTGSCQGGSPFTCQPPDTCHNAGTCDSNRPLPTPPSTQDLLGWWKLDGDGEDATAGNHDLTNEGAVPEPGRSGMAMRFDGSSCMTAPIWDEARMQGAGGLTVMAWMKPDVYTCTEQYDLNAVVGRGWDYSIGSWCYLPTTAPYAQGLAAAVRPANAQTWGYGGGWLLTSEWHHVVLTWDHQNVTTYLDGKGFASYPLTDAEASDWDPMFAVGCMTSWYWSGFDRIHNFHGAVDEVMLYRRALTGAEISSYYAAADPCTHQALPDDTACFDDNWCTQGDTCHAGTCIGTQPVTCAAPDSCHNPGTCYPWSGCVNPPLKPDGASCNDGQTCTQGETCHAGACEPPASPAPLVLNLPAEDLGSFGSASFAAGINASGTIVGYSHTPEGTPHAWRWTAPGPLVNLDPLLGLSPPSAAEAVNDSGVIVGFQTRSDGAHMFRSGGAAGFEDLGTISDGSSGFFWEWLRGTYAIGMNNAGDFVGVYTTGGTVRGFRFIDGVPEPVGTLAPNGSTYLYAISESGTAVGSSWAQADVPTSDRAVLFDNALVGLVDLNDLVANPVPGFTLTAATSISGDYIAGWGMRDGAVLKYVAFRWNRATGALDVLDGGWVSNWAWDVNAAGDIVGAGGMNLEEWTASIGRAFVFTDQLGFKKLDDLVPQASGWSLRSAYSINASGEIVGTGFRTGLDGRRAFHVKLPPGQAAACTARNTCGGDDGDAICLYSDGVVETTPGHFVAVFGFDNASSTDVHPNVNEVRLDGNLIPSPQPAPPADLAPGTHTGAFLATFDAGHAISWTVNGESVTASASSPRLPTVVVGDNGVGVVIGGTTIVIIPDGMGPCPPPASFCQEPGTRNAQGVCTYPTKPDGTACNDNNACTRADLCQAGACVGADPVPCIPPDSCHTASCNPATGVCSTTMVAGACNLGAFEYDLAGRLIRDRSAELRYDAYDQLREVLPTASPPPFTNLQVDDLKTPGPGENQAFARHPNAQGHVPVTVEMASGVYRTLLFRGNGTPEDLSARLGISTTLHGNAISDSGAVAGSWSATGTSVDRAFRYDQNGFHDLGNPGDLTVAFDVNDANQVSGYFVVGGLVHGYRHSDATGFQEIGTLGGAQSWGWVIDDLGVVSASAQTPDTPSTGFERLGHAALYQDIIGLQDLNDFLDPMAGTTLVVANEKTGDWVVGGGLVGGAQRAYRLKLSTSALDDIGWDGSSIGVAVNAAGDAVGWGHVDAGNTVQAAWILSERTGFAKLNDLIDPASGWDLRVPSGIDDFGTVFGWGYHNGRVSAFRLRIPAHSSGTGGPVVAEVHTYGYDGLRTSTTTAPGTTNANTQVWFTQDYSERDGKREHYVRLGSRIVAKVTLQPPMGGGSGGMGLLIHPRHRSIDLGDLLAKILLALLVAGGCAATAAGMIGRKRRPAWVAATAGPVILFFLASCDEVGTNRRSAATVWERIQTVYFHQGLSVGPVLTTNANGTLREERRYEPFGHPIDANVAGSVAPVDFRSEPQNSLGKLTNPNTGWSYHGARWMAPQLGHWTAPDPAVKGPTESSTDAPWTLNPYTYADQNPSTHWDPDGLAPAPVWADVDTTMLRSLAAARGIGKGGFTVKDNQQAGLAFQNLAIRVDVGANPNGRIFPSPVRENMTGGYRSGVRPDGIGDMAGVRLTMGRFPSPSYLPGGYIVEVKAVKGTITLASEDYQLTGILDVAEQSAKHGIGSMSVPRVTFPTTSDTTIGSDVILSATAKGITLGQRTLQYCQTCPAGLQFRLSAETILNPQMWVDGAQVFPQAQPESIPTELTASGKKPPVDDPDPPVVH